MYIIEYGDRDHKQVFVLDDVLGIFAVEMNTYNNIITHKEMIFTTIGQTSKLLFTCRKSILKSVCDLKFAKFVDKIFEWFIEEAFSQPLVFFIQ
jgi:hypothetical protein